jgi:hypothetical protein
MASRALIEPEVVSAGPDTVRILKNVDELRVIGWDSRTLK